MSPGTARELKISALWALAVSTPISLFGWVMSFWIAHGGGIFLVLFIPGMLFGWVIQGCCRDALSEMWFAPAEVFT